MGTDLFSFKPVEDSLRGKAVLVTGGTYGIAKAIVEGYCYAGSRVVFCARNAELGTKIAEDFSEKYRADCRFFHCDVTNHKDIERTVEFSAQSFGGIDILVNCAGLWPEQKPIDRLSIEEFENLFELNMVAYFAFCKFTIPYLRKSRGSIVNIGSVLGSTGKEGATLYCSTKGAIESFSRTLAIDEARNGVRVNEVKPGHIHNEAFYDAVEKNENPEAFQDYHNHLQWLGRGGEGREIATAVMFLSSDWASFITGTSLLVSGGYEIGEGEKRYHALLQ